LELSRSLRARGPREQTPADLLGELIATVQKETGVEFAPDDMVIPADLRFRDWCGRLAVDRVDPKTGKRLAPLKVDGQPAHGTGTFILPNVEQVRPNVPGSAVDLYQSRTSGGVPPVVAGLMSEIDQARSVTCGGCSYFPFGDEAPPAFGECPIQKARVMARDPGCYAHDPIGSS
jgi:hypothetical protein